MINIVAAIICGTAAIITGSIAYASYKTGDDIMMVTTALGSTFNVVMCVLNIVCVFSVAR